MTRKRKRRKPEQIVKLLQEGEAMFAVVKSEAEVFQKLEITESTWQRWNSQYGGMNSDEAKRVVGVLSGNSSSLSSGSPRAMPALFQALISAPNLLDD